jgi:stress-induced morphogen
MANTTTTTNDITRPRLHRSLVLQGDRGSMKRNAIAALGLLSGYSKIVAPRTTTLAFQQHQNPPVVLVGRLPLFRGVSIHHFSRAFSSTATTTTTTTTMSATASPTTEAAIRAILQKPPFVPVEHLEVINESHTHNVPKNSETHFKVVIVSPVFENIAKSPIQRHRLVHQALHDQFMDNGGTVHALSIVAKSPQQWQAMMDAGQRVPPSPKCHGGDGSLPKP